MTNEPTNEASNPPSQAPACGSYPAAVCSAPVDLRSCNPGDRLRSCHGMILTYVAPLPASDYMNHEVRYPNGARGTRTHDGFVFRKNRMECDHNIVEIMPNNKVSGPEPAAKGSHD